MTDNDSKYEVIHKLSYQSRHIRTNSVFRKGAICIQSTDTVVDKRIYDRRDNECDCTAHENIPGAADCIIQRLIYRNFVECVELGPVTRDKGHQLHHHTHNQVHHNREQRQLNRCLGPESLGNHVHAQKAEPRYRESAVQRQPRQTRRDFLIREKVHQDDRHGEESHYRGRDGLHESLPVPEFLFEIHC